MTALIYLVLTMVAIGGTVVVITREPRGQAVTLSLYGVLLTVLFVLVQAPDVALSQLAVGGAFVPLLVLLAVHTVRAPKSARHKRSGR